MGRGNRRRCGHGGSAVSDRSATAPQRISGPWYWGAEASCLLLGLALAASTARLFSTTGAVVVLASVAAGAWALAVALRRSPLPPVLGDSLHLLTGAALLLWVVAPDARLGPFPGPDSVATLAEMVRDDFSRFDDDIAPMVARPGHLAVLGGLTWVLALFCSTTAMRLRAPVQAALPHIVAIVGLGFVSRSESRTTATAVLLLAVGLYALAQSAWRNDAYRWQPPGTSAVPRQLATAGAFLAVAALTTAALTPMSPVASDPVLDLRRGGLGGGGPRTVVSPFVEVGSNLGPLSNDLLFSATSDSPGYWRLTALEDFDPDTASWALANSYERVGGGTLERTDTPSGALLNSTVEVVALGGIWVPVPDAPVTVDSASELNWDPESGSLVKRSGDLTTGDTFDFGSEPDRIDNGSLADSRAVTSDPGLVDPSGIPPGLAVEAQRLTAGLTPYESALALQNWFRDEITYDETVDYSDEPDPTGAFLEQRRGFCQQFSTAFALAARSVGLPTRVVVGFTTGVPDPGAPGTFDVYGRNAHAWPEVLLSGVGWVPFEPTPGRGNPSATEFTGVPGAQAEPPPEGAEGEADTEPDGTATTAPVESPTPEPGSAAGTSEEVEAGAPGEADADGTRDRWSVLALAALLAVVVIAAGVMVAVALRRRRAAAGVQPGDPVRGAWIEACAALASATANPLAMHDNETPLEFARRAEELTGTRSVTALAQLESMRRWSEDGLDDAHSAEAAALVQSLRSELSESAAAQTAVEESVL